MPNIDMLNPRRSRMKPREDGKIVFCKECRFSRGMNFMDCDKDETCEYPDNIYMEKYYDAPMKKYRGSPSDINKYNSCVWYEPRRNLFLRIFNIFKGR